MSKPLSVVAVLLSAFVLANAFIVGCGGGGGSTEGSGDASGTEDHGTGGETAGSTDGAGGGDNALVAQGQTIYAEKCALCHGASGKGDGPGAAALEPKPRNHTEGAYMNAQTNEQLHEVIKNGKGQMPAWGATMSDQEIDAVIAYVRTLAEPAYPGPTP